MLPTMQPVERSRTKRARAVKAFEEVRVGAVRLYFSHYELIAFRLDGEPPVVLKAPATAGVDTGAFVEQHRLHLEPERSKWCPAHEFERRWLEISEEFFKTVR